MKKQRHKSKKVARKKGINEPEINLEHQRKVNVLATQFEEDKLKAVLRRCYSDVQKYGPEAIMKAVENNWTASVAVDCNGIVERAAHSSDLDKDAFAFVKVEEEVTDKRMRENLEVEAIPAYGTTHDHEITSKHNALFLIESSEQIDYDSDMLMKMKRAYERGNYDDVADLAYLHDRNRRSSPQWPKCQTNDETTLCREELASPWKRISELLTEVADEDQRKETPLKCCVEAVRHLSRDLTYNNMGAAKDSIRKAIKHLEE